MAFEPFTFLHSSRRVIFGWDSLSELAELAKEFGCKRPAVVLDAFFMPTPLKDRLPPPAAGNDTNAPTGTEPLFHAVPGHEPDTASVETCAASLKRAIADFVIGVGGGTAMDT